MTPQPDALPGLLLGQDYDGVAVDDPDRLGGQSVLIGYGKGQAWQQEQQDWVRVSAWGDGGAYGLWVPDLQPATAHPFLPQPPQHQVGSWGLVRGAWIG